MYPLSIELCLMAVTHHTQILHIMYQANGITGKAMGFKVRVGASDHTRQCEI